MILVQIVILAICAQILIIRMIIFVLRIVQMELSMMIVLSNALNVIQAVLHVMAKVNLTV